MRVRELQWGDFEDLAASYFQCYDDRDAGRPVGIALMDERPSWADEAGWFARLFEGVQRGRILALVAEVDGHAVGLCTATRDGPPQDSDVSHAATLGILVAREHRGAGVGTALMTEAIARSRGRFELLHLDVLRDNVGARRLYEGLGFVPAGSLPRAVKRGDRYHDLDRMYLALGPVSRGPNGAPAPPTE